MAAAGCGLGPGKDQGDVALTVTRDYGGQVLLQKTDSIHESDTAFRVLDRSADVTTRYGGGFVQSIDGLAGSQSGGRSSDWFFYVNGIESPIGSAQFDLSGGDRIWWDYRDWTAAMRVPAVVGSWPEPFVHGFQGKRYRAAVSCEGATAPCDQVEASLKRAGVDRPDRGRLGGRCHDLRGPLEAGGEGGRPEAAGRGARRRAASSPASSEPGSPCSSCSTRRASPSAPSARAAA